MPDLSIKVGFREPLHAGNTFRISEKLPNLLPLRYYLLLAKNPHKSRKSEELRVNSEKVKIPVLTNEDFWWAGVVIDSVIFALPRLLRLVCQIYVS